MSGWWQLKNSFSEPESFRGLRESDAWGPFLERPDNYSGAQRYFKVRIYKTLA